MVSRKKYSKRGGSMNPLSPHTVNFESNPTRFSSDTAYLKNRACPGTYSNVTAAGGKNSTQPYAPGPMIGGKPVYCLAKNPMLMDGGHQITPYGPRGGAYASVESCPPFSGARPEQIPMKGGRTRKLRGGQPLVRAPCGQGVLSPAPYPANTVSGVGVGGGRRTRRRGGHRRRRGGFSAKQRIRKLRGGKKHSRKHHKKYRRGSKSKTRSGHKDFETWEGSKDYKTHLPGVKGRRLAPEEWGYGKKLFGLVGGSGGGQPVKGYSSFNDMPSKVPPPTGKANLQPYSNQPISFGQRLGGNLSPNQSGLANPPPQQPYFNCQKNNFPPPN